jgi:hypothetical protein
MRKYLKEHFSLKSGFGQIRSEVSFVITLQDGNQNHKFTVKITPECNIHTQFMIGGKVSKEVFKFIQKYDHDIVNGTYIRERDRYLMLVVENRVHYIGFSPFVPLTLSLYQTEKVMKQLYELKGLIPSTIPSFIPFCDLSGPLEALPETVPSVQTKVSSVEQVVETVVQTMVSSVEKAVEPKVSSVEQAISLNDNTCVVNPQA